MKRPIAAFFCMPEKGHYQLLRPLISGLARRRFTVTVFTHRQFEADIKRLGGSFIDLFEKYPIESADGESLPVPCRFVSFAGRYADEILADLKKIKPSLIVYETFAVIGRVVAAALGVPYVNVSPGHNMDPTRFLSLLRADVRTKISPSCHRAVNILRKSYGLHDASPFSYVSTLSPFLNIYCEPAAYLEKKERRVFEPVAFFGSLPPAEELAKRRGDGGSLYFGNAPNRLKMYVCFGTVVWRYYAAEAFSALKSISKCLASMRNVDVLISLGGEKIGNASLRALANSRVRVVDHVDQWKILQEADVFVTHHGLNSTHEAIFNRVPMISYPFFSDQPALAEKCQRFGLAIPLTGSLRGRVSEKNIHVALTRLSRNRRSVHAKLEQARDWERSTVASRDSVLQKIAELSK